MGRDVAGAAVLFVEVTDNRLVPPRRAGSRRTTSSSGASRRTGSGRGSGCFQPDPDAKALQWGIALDGQVYKAHGAPVASPTVRVTRTDGTRFRIVLPDEGTGLTVVYSDSDDGARQKRLIATSKLEFGRTWTIGGVTTIGAGRATCVVTGGALRPKVAPRRRYPGLLFKNLPPEFDGD